MESLRHVQRSTSEAAVFSASSYLVAFTLWFSESYSTTVQNLSELQKPSPTIVCGLSKPTKSEYVSVEMRGSPPLFMKRSGFDVVFFTSWPAPSYS